MFYKRTHVTLSNIEYLSANGCRLVIVLHGGVAMFDVIVVGGGPAGLSAALMLGRCRRRVLGCDGGGPRNRRSPALPGYLTRDGIDPPSPNEPRRGQLPAH